MGEHAHGLRGEYFAVACTYGTRWEFEFNFEVGSRVRRRLDRVHAGEFWRFSQMLACHGGYLRTTVDLSFINVPLRCAVGRAERNYIVRTANATQMQMMES